MCARVLLGFAAGSKGASAWLGSSEAHVRMLARGAALRRREAIRDFRDGVVGPTGSWDHIALIAGEAIADPRFAIDPILQLGLKLGIAAVFLGEADAESVEPCSAKCTTMFQDLRGDQAAHRAA